jgi:hypothetical protein
MFRVYSKSVAGVGTKFPESAKVSPVEAYPINELKRFDCKPSSIFDFSLRVLA